MRVSNLLLKISGAGLLLASFSSCSSTDAKPEKNLVKLPELPEETILENGIATYDEGLFKVSLQSWGELRDGYPTSYYSTLAEIKIADAHFFSGDYPAALAAYEEFAKLHPGHEAMPYIRYQIGNCSFKQYRDVMHDQAPLQTALKSYEQLIHDHPQSEYVVLARRQIDRSRELQAAYERYVAEFYDRKGLETAANSRLKKLTTDFPGSKAYSAVKEEELNEEEKKIIFGDGSKIITSKPPSAPKILNPVLMSDEKYAESLRSVAERTRKSGADVQETELISSESKSAPQSESLTPENSIYEFSCDESEIGPVYIATLKFPVSYPKTGAISRFSWVRTKLEPVQKQSELCSAGGVSVEIQSDNAGISFKIPENEQNKASFIVLNRPNRVVLTISE